MDTITSTITVILGLLFRLALPIGVTAFIVWALKKLDAHWQAESKQDMSPPSIKVENPGCWTIFNCSEEKRAGCKAFAHPETPCWQVYRVSHGQLQESCLGCQVFKEALVPIPV
jgi:hypothetical protein